LQQCVSGADEASSLRQLNRFLSTDLAAVEYGRLRGTLSVAETPIAPNDLMIATIALSRFEGRRTPDSRLGITKENHRRSRRTGLSPAASPRYLANASKSL